jgi:signal transduction histidine kinase
MLRRGVLPADKQARAVDAIWTSASRQRDLVNDLLDVARLAAGKMRLDRHPLDFGALCAAATEAVRPLAHAKGVRLEQSADGPGAILVIGDPARLHQVVSNLLTNAIKYTPSGGRVDVSWKAAGGRAVLTVSDSGAGIAAELLPHVFEPFRQAEAGAGGGLGLGLSIALRIVQLHGGTIDARSPGDGRGATFILAIPETS